MRIKYKAEVKMHILRRHLTLDSYSLQSYEMNKKVDENFVSKQILPMTIMNIQLSLFNNCFPIQLSKSLFEKTNVIPKCS